MWPVTLAPVPDAPLPTILVATVFGAGLVEPLRALLAVLIVVPVAFWIQRGEGRAGGTAVLLAVICAGFWAATVWIAVTGTSDAREIVIDEAAGFLLAAMVSGRLRSPLILILVPTFLALDRWKPWPIGLVEQIPGAGGVMGDDLVAGFVLGVAVLGIRKAIIRAV
jgi:phosphatidylglycerophosphatase A